MALLNIQYHSMKPGSKCSTLNIWCSRLSFTATYQLQYKICPSSTCTAYSCTYYMSTFSTLLNW